MPETKVRSGQLGTSLTSKTIDSTNTISTDLTKLTIAGGTDGQVLSTNGSGTLSFITASGGGGQVQVDKFSSSGTWTKPAWAKLVSVYLLAGGSGGGSGQRNATTLGRGGGGGGAGSMYAGFVGQASDFTSTVTVTVGAGGAGGASITTNSTVGNNGGTGGASSFGTYKVTGTNYGGQGGLVGTSTGGGTNANNLGWIYLGFQDFVGYGGNLTLAPSRTSTINFLGSLGATGGSGAGPNSTTLQGGSSHQPSNWPSQFPNWVYGASGTNGGAGGNGSNNPLGYLLFGSAGGGGSYKTAQATGAGGNGGYGAGGGGGAASDNGFASGAGGNGGGGLVIVISEG